MRRLFALAALCLCAAACDVKLPNLNLPDGGSDGGPPPIDLTVFGGGAQKLLADVGNARLEIDPTQRDALTALGQCADLVSYCYAARGATISNCFDRTAKCTTQEPWNEQPCCPAACKTAYETELAAGAKAVDALEKVLFREPDCFPGVRAALEAP